jgi:hypothetical protein
MHPSDEEGWDRKPPANLGADLLDISDKDLTIGELSHVPIEASNDPRRTESSSDLAPTGTPATMCGAQGASSNHGYVSGELFQSRHHHGGLSDPICIRRISTEAKAYIAGEWQ